MISLLTFYLFIFMVLTGMVLYIVPPTRIANEMQWTLMGISKNEYIRMHTILSFAFCVSGVLHLWYNRFVLWRYLLGGGMATRWKFESTLAVGVLLFVLFAGYFNLPPVPSIMSWGTWMKESWGGPGGGGQSLYQGRKHVLLPGDYMLRQR